MVHMISIIFLVELNAPEMTLKKYAPDAPRFKAPLLTNPTFLFTLNSRKRQATFTSFSGNVDHVRNNWNNWCRELGKQYL